MSGEDCPNSIDNLVEIFFYRSQKAPVDESIYVGPHQFGDGAFGKGVFKNIRPGDYVKILKVYRTNSTDSAIDENPNLYVKAKLHPDPDCIPWGRNLVHCGPYWANRYPDLLDTKCTLFLEVTKPTLKERLYLWCRDSLKVLNKDSTS